jgi:hypothetical protein
MSSSQGPKERKSSSDVARDRAARRDLLPGLVALVVTEGSLMIADPNASAGPAQLAWSLSPLVAIGLLVWGQLRILGRSDERERLQQLTAMAVGFGVFAVSLAAVGVLQSADIGDAVQQTQITFVVGILAWVAALAIPASRTS